MGVRENKVETYLRNQIKLIGGGTRKWVSPGRDGVPDQIVFCFNNIFFVEVKTTDGKFEPGQEREHTRLRELGATVCTVYGNTGVDSLIKKVKTCRKLLIKYYA